MIDDGLLQGYLDLIAAIIKQSALDCAGVVSTDETNRDTARSFIDQLGLQQEQIDRVVTQYLDTYYIKGAKSSSMQRKAA